MQTTKFLFVIGAAAILVAPLQVTAGPDNEAQAKMREALRQKMVEMNAQTAPAPAPAPVTVPAVVIEPAPAVTAGSELKPMERPATVVVPVPVEPAATPVMVVVPAPVKVSKQGSQFSEVPEDAAAANTARMQEALRQQLAAEKANQPMTVVVAPAAPVKSAPVVVKSAPVFSQPPTANLEVAPSPLSGSKQQRLAELLRRYKADEITPQDYHTQRAAIVAEP